MARKSAATVLGVDACRGGWVGVVLHDGRFTGAHVRPSLAEVVALVPDAAVVGVDMPLGLARSGERGTDRAAKQLLDRRRSSIFEIPPEPCWSEATHAAASALSKRLTGKGMSIQAWGLRTKLLEANALYAADEVPLREVHPELAFQAMGLTFDDGSKKTWRGQRARLRVLVAAGIDVPEDLGADVARVPADDVLDAAAVAWSAVRIHAGRASCVPDPPQYNERGQRMAIWF
jgi:predicted RNase H-like nuclease